MSASETVALDAVRWTLGALVLLAGLVVYLPQLARTWLRRDAAGLSPSALLFGVVGYSAWWWYLIEARMWALFVANAVGTLVGYLLLYAAWRAGLRYADAWKAPALSALVAVVAAIVDYRLFGILLTVNSVFIFIPKAVAAWRSPTITGISVTTWLLLMASSLAHLGLGLLGAPVAVLLWGILVTGVGIAILSAIVFRTEARHPTTPVSLGHQDDPHSPGLASA